MNNHSIIAGKMIRSGIAALISGFILFFCVPVQAADKIEKYNYDLKYSLKVPAEYENKIVSLSAGRMNVQFSDTVYFALSAEKYYDSLNSDEIGDYSESDYSMGKTALDATFNDSDYVTEYFQKKLNSIVGSERIEQIAKQTVNGKDFWVCDYVIYTQSTDPTTNESVTTDVGEGKMYFNMTDGISYFITIQSSQGPLSTTPAALDVMDSFHIGKQYGPSVYVVWTIIGILILAFLYFLNRHFRILDVELEDEDGNTMILTGPMKEAIPDEDDGWAGGDTVLLPSIKEIRKKEDRDYSKAVKEDTFADGQITQVMPLEQDEDAAQKEQLLEKLDKMMQRFKKVPNSESINSAEEEQITQVISSVMVEDESSEAGNNKITDQNNDTVHKIWESIKTFFSENFAIREISAKRDSKEEPIKNASENEQSDEREDVKIRYYQSSDETALSDADEQNTETSTQSPSKEAIPEENDSLLERLDEMMQRFQSDTDAK